MDNRKVTPKDFFLWVAAMAALYESTVSLLALWFEYINRTVGTVSQYADPFSTGLRIAVASLIIIFPLYIYLMRLLHQDIRRVPEKKELWVRRWLLVLTLFGAAVTIVIDLIILLNTFLGGEELTTAFLLKVFSVLFVVGGAFWYYLNEIRGTWERDEQTSKLIAYGVALVVFASVVGAFFIIGTPHDLRVMRYDQQKVNDLQNIQSQVTSYWQQKKKLPSSLTDLADPLSGFVVPQDLQAGEGSTYQYEYRATGPMSFEICATFNKPSIGTGSVAGGRTVPVPVGYYGPDTEYWTHDTGRTCFPRTIDPERYPPFAKPVM